MPMIPDWKTVLVPIVLSIAVYLYHWHSNLSPQSSPVDMADTHHPANVYSFTVKNARGEDVSLEKYKGQVLLIVNVASLCGLTDTNYKELAELDTQLHDAGLRILAFPCNQFGSQEPGSNQEIVCFANKYKAHFDMFEKVDVNGKNAHPLYDYLKNAQSGWFGNAIKWNFTKFIVNRQGIPVERHAPTTAPLKLVPALRKYLAEE